MESTGKYWIPIFNILEQGDIRVMLTHPKFVKAIKGKIQIQAGLYALV